MQGETSDLFLESKDVGNAAVDRVPDASQCLVRDGDGSVCPGVKREVVQKLGDVARPEDLVDCSKVTGSLVIAEVRSKHTLTGALPPQELACST